MGDPRTHALDEARTVLIELSEYLERVDKMNSGKSSVTMPENLPVRLRELATYIWAHMELSRIPSRSVQDVTRTQDNA